MEHAGFSFTLAVRFSMDAFPLPIHSVTDEQKPLHPWPVVNKCG